MAAQRVEEASWPCWDAPGVGGQQVLRVLRILPGGPRVEVPRAAYLAMRPSPAQPAPAEVAALPQGSPPLLGLHRHRYRSRDGQSPGAGVVPPPDVLSGLLTQSCASASAAAGGPVRGRLGHVHRGRRLRGRLRLGALGHQTRAAATHGACSAGQRKTRKSVTSPATLNHGSGSWIKRDIVYHRSGFPEYMR